MNNGNTVWVIFYKDRQNLGDDVFEHVFGRLFSSYLLELINADDVPLVAKLAKDGQPRAIVVGGGDVINSYFLDKLEPLFAKLTCPIYAFGIGIPYPNLIEEGKLDAFDFIVHRTWTAHDRLVARYGPHMIHYGPDLAWLTATLPPPPHQVASRGILDFFFPSKPLKVKTKRIGIYLARPMCRNPEGYAKIVDGLAQFFLSLASAYTDPKGGRKGELTTAEKRRIRRDRVYHYHLEFVPFCAPQVPRASEDDRIMNKDVVARMLELRNGDPMGNVEVVTVSPPIAELLPWFKRYDFSVCSRFHAHVFSLMAQVPVLSVACTNKVKSLMTHAGLLPFCYELPVGADFAPTECDATVLTEKWDLLLKNEDSIRKHLAIYAETITKPEAIETGNLMCAALYHLPQAVTRFNKTEPPADKVAQLIHSLTEGHHALIEEIIHSPGGIKRAGLKACHLDRVVRAMSFLLTGKPVSDYSWGIKEDLLSDSYTFSAACKWIFEDQRAKVNSFPKWKRSLNASIPCSPLYDFEYCKAIVSGDEDSVHRSGWGFVMDNLATFHSPTATEVFDSYLDETFGWRYDVLRDAGKLPITRPWKGVIHHTANLSFSENNCARMFKRPAWRSSLGTCKGLITLSKYLADEVKDHLLQAGYPDIPVHVLKHPTEFPEKLFQCRNFLPDMAIVQVGAWYRNTNAIFQLQVPFGSKLRKLAIQGKAMDRSYLTNEQFETFITDVTRAWNKTVLQIEGTHGDGGHCTGQYGCTGQYNSEVNESPLSCVQDSGQMGVMGPKSLFPSSTDTVPLHVLQHISPYVIGARDASIKALVDQHASVTMLGHQSNEEYDALLSRSIVFLNLIDASAVNTLIECIARNTPVLVNPLPATIEYLGEKYPFFYHSMEEASAMATNTDLIHAAHKYLKAMDKTLLQITTFIKAFAAL